MRSRLSQDLPPEREASPREEPTPDPVEPGPRSSPQAGELVEPAFDDDFDIAVALQEFSEESTTPSVDPGYLTLLAKSPDARRSSDGVPEVPPDAAPGLATAMRSGHLARIAGIDFGTSFSRVAVVIDNRSYVLPVEVDGGQALPSVVGLDRRGHALVGQRAQEMWPADPENVIASPKRLLGRAFRERELEPYLAQLPMMSTEGRHGQVLLHARGRTYSVVQLCAPILARLRQAIHEQVGQTINDVVLTVPVSFDEQRRQALNQAAQLAGLNVRGFLDEPSAAALAHRRDLDSGGLVAVYDFGGGTFDFSVVRVGANAALSVVANAGDSWLGGDDFDEALAGAIADGFWRQTSIELRHRRIEWQQLLRAAEQAKRQLSTQHATELHISQIVLSRRGPLDLTTSVTRELFAALSQHLIERSLDTCRAALELSGLRFSDLSAVYMSGGTSYIPAVLEAVARTFGKIPLVAVPPEKAVVLGAAAYASLLDARVFA